MAPICSAENKRVFDLIRRTTKYCEGCRIPSL